MQFTQTRINALQCPPGQRDALFKDKGQRGLAIRVLQSGSRSYRAEYTRNGKKYKIPLGSCAAISLAQARAAVQAIMGDLARGIDPIGVRKQAATRAITFEELLDDWQALHLNGRRAGYAAEATGTLRRVFAACLNGPAGSLGRPAIVHTLDALSRKGSNAMAAAAASYGRACYGWALKRGVVDANPFSKLPVAAAVRRERILSDAEIAAIWHATDGPGPFNHIVRMLILTGQRRGEVGGMTWAELSDDLSTWTILGGRTKNGRTHVVPLPESARAFLYGLQRSDDLVFPGMHGIFDGYGGAKRTLDARSGVTGWVLHDLRRTFATGLQRLGTRLEVTEACLNHVGGSRAGIVSIYQRHDYRAEKRAALEAWASHVANIIRTGGRHA